MLGGEQGELMSEVDRILQGLRQRGLDYRPLLLPNGDAAPDAWVAECPLCLPWIPERQWEEHRRSLAEGGAGTISTLGIGGTLRIHESEARRVTLGCTGRHDPERISHMLLRPDRCFDCGYVFGEIERLQAELRERDEPRPLRRVA
jgi:hypothetical protein